MKKLVASFAVVAFLIAFSAPAYSMENEVVTTVQVEDEKPKKKETKKEKAEDTKKESECTKKKKCCSEKKDKA